MKSCPSCDSVIPGSLRVCPYCKFEFPIEVKELELGELVEITKDYSSLAGKLVSQLDPYNLSVYVKTLNKKPYGARVARAKEQESEGFLKEYSRHMGYKDTWIDHQLNMIGEEKIEYMDLMIKGFTKVEGIAQ